MALSATRMTIAEMRKGLRKREFSAVELTHLCLDAIARSERLNAFVYTDPERAIKMAQQADERLAHSSGDAPSMCGIPVGIKDLFCVRGAPSEAASRMLKGFVPSYDSMVTQKLWENGAVFLGKLNMDEFAMGSSNEYSAHGPVVSPWRAIDSEVYLSPGGSSGGSSAAVSADLCVAATGSDTGGSIRQPSAFTGLVGLKPTYGRCSRWGMIAFASSLDQAGPIVKTVHDAAIMLSAMAGYDSRDATSYEAEVPDFEGQLSSDLRGKKVGIPNEYRVEGMPVEIDKLWHQGIEWLKDAGAEVVNVSLPHTKYALPVYYIIALAEASSNLARYDGVRYGCRAKGRVEKRHETAENLRDFYSKNRSEGFGHEVQRRILLGTYVLSSGYYNAYYTQAQKVRQLIRKDFDEVFGAGIDCLLTPTTPFAAFELGTLSKQDPVKMYMNDVFTVTANLAGLPAISVPAGVSNEGLPLGLQIIGSSWGESMVLNAALAIENSAAFFYKPSFWWSQSACS